MKVVIDIPDGRYNQLMTDDIYLDVPIFKEDIIATLPKGHGRIKDIDKIEWYGCTSEFDCSYKGRECKDCNRAECDKEQVDAIPTIIEEDESEG